MVFNSQFSLPHHNLMGLVRQNSNFGLTVYMGLINRKAQPQQYFISYFKIVNIDNFHTRL